MSVRVRYAPSPTGHLHIGGVRTALFNLLFAKHHHGEFLLRLEDTDLERNVPGAEEEMLNGFRWLGFDWAEGPDIGGSFGPYRCTERLDIYEGYLRKLRDASAVYPCFCTQEQLEVDRAQAMSEGRMPVYSGRCRHLSETERQDKINQGIPYSWRVAVPGELTLELHDLVRGPVQFDAEAVGDFVIVKSNGMPTYNFQVVIDDALMKISHVIRGEEHLSNTPRQLVIYQLLGLQVPSFAHLPQVLNEDKKKLSKRDPNVLPVHVYQEQGYLPEALVNFLALLGWSPGGEEEIFSLEELAQKFELERVSRSGAVFDIDKLRWMAGQYIKHCDSGVLTKMVERQLQKEEILVPDNRESDWLRGVVELYQEKMTCAADFPRLAKGFLVEDVVWTDEAVAVMKDGSAPEVIALYLKLTDEDDEPWTPEASKARFKVVQKTLGVKGKGLFMPVRAALTGEIHGPDLQRTVAYLSKPWVIRRLKRALERVAFAK